MLVITSRGFLFALNQLVLQSCVYTASAGKASDMVPYTNCNQTFGSLFWPFISSKWLKSKTMDSWMDSWVTFPGTREMSELTISPLWGLCIYPLVCKIHQQITMWWWRWLGCLKKDLIVRQEKENGACFILQLVFSWTTSHSCMESIATPSTTEYLIMILKRHQAMQVHRKPRVPAFLILFKDYFLFELSF